MPRFLDHHPMPAPVMPAQVLQGEMMRAVKKDIESGLPDKFGVKGINVFVSKDQIFCLSEAPTTEAVHKSHEAKGIRLGPADVTEILPLV